MNKFKKIGLTALATSLVASSAYAAEVSVTGAAGLTFVTENGNSGDAGDHGKGFGTDNSMSFGASGEMDNGWSVATNTAFTDAAAITSNTVALTMGSLGTVTWGHSAGGNAGSYDGGAGAYEEVDDGAPTSLSHNLIGSTSDNGGLAYASPSLDLGAGLSATIHVGYSPKTTNANVAGGGASGAATLGASENVGVTLSHDSGLTLGAYGNTIERLATTGEDSFQGAWYASYAIGPVSLYYAQSYVNNGVNGTPDAATADKTFAAGTGQFEGDQYAITMNVNDNLSVSYAKADDTYDAKAGAAADSTTGTSVADVTMSMKSIQAAYSMGSMSIKAYRLDVDNVGYNNGGRSNQKTEIALGLSF